MSNAFGQTVEPRRTRNFKRRSAFAASGALLAAAAALAVPTQAANAAPADDACVLQELPMPADKYFSLVTAMSNDGEIIAYRVYPAELAGDERDMYLYEDGEAVKVPMPGVDQHLGAVNDEGLAVGSAWVDGMQLPYVYRDGELTELAVNDGGAATGVNEDGDIVGFSGQGAPLPIVWRDGQVKPLALPLPEGANGGVATSIDDDGTIVGSYQDSETGLARPYMWHPDGTGEALPIPEGVDPADAIISASDIAGEWVSGNLFTPETESGVRWNLDDGTAELVDLTYAPAINEEGTVSGDSMPNAAFQEAGEKAVNLPGLTDPADNWFGDIATEISEDGELLAGQVYAGQDAADNHILKAVTWTCD